ncbi:unnamed protein product, partial [Prunus brigantina]
KGTPLLVLEEPILVAKLQKISHKHSPPTRHLGSTTEKVDPCKPTRKCTMRDFDPENHLKHFKSLMIFYKAKDVLMCKVFAMTLRGAAQDWFHTLPSGSTSSFKELAYVFTKEYTSYRTIKKNPDHLYNLCKKPDESL